MPLFMDHHRGVEGLTAEAVADAHRNDMEIQDQYGVKYHRYWFNVPAALRGLIRNAECEETGLSSAVLTGETLFIALS